MDALHETSSTASKHASRHDAPINVLALCCKDGLRIAEDYNPWTVQSYSCLQTYKMTQFMLGYLSRQQGNSLLSGKQ